MTDSAAFNVDREPRKKVAPVAIRDRFRIRFAKTGLLRWIGHGDLLRLWERLLRRSDLQLSMSTGFHPRARMSFPSALALGVEGLDEVVEIELAQSITVEALRSRLVADGQPGLAIGEVELMAVNGGNGGGSSYSPGLSKAMHHSSEFEVEIPEEFDLTQVDRGIELAKTLGEISIQRKEKTVMVSIADTFPTISRRENFICVTQFETTGASPKITDLLDAMELNELLPCGAIIRRTRLHIIDEEPRILTSAFSSENLSDNKFKTPKT